MNHRGEKDAGQIKVAHRPRDGHPETGSVGVLERTAGGWAFDFVPDDDLTPFTRHNGK